MTNLGATWSNDMGAKDSAEQTRLREAYIQAWEGVGALHYTYSTRLMVPPPTRIAARTPFSVPTQPVRSSVQAAFELGEGLGGGGLSKACLVMANHPFVQCPPCQRSMLLTNKL